MDFSFFCTLFSDLPEVEISRTNLEHTSALKKMQEFKLELVNKISGLQEKIDNLETKSKNGKVNSGQSLVKGIASSSKPPKSNKKKI